MNIEVIDSRSVPDIGPIYPIDNSEILFMGIDYESIVVLRKNYRTENYNIGGARRDTTEISKNGDIFVSDWKNQDKINRYIIENDRVVFFKEMRPVISYNFFLSHNGRPTISTYDLLISGYNGRVVAFQKIAGVGFQKITGKESEIIYVDLDGKEYKEKTYQQSISGLERNARVNRYAICCYYNKQIYKNLVDNSEARLPKKYYHAQFLSEKYSLVMEDVPRHEPKYYIFNFSTNEIIFEVNTSVVSIDRKRDIVYYSKKNSNVYAKSLVDDQEEELIIQMNSEVEMISSSQDYLYVKTKNGAYLVELYHIEDLFDRIELAMNEVEDKEELTEVYQALGIVFENLKLDINKRKGKK